MKHKKKLLSAVASMACMSVLLLSGCGTDPSNGAALSERDVYKRQVLNRLIVDDDDRIDI